MSDDDDDDESYCDCADDLERHHRIEKAADGQIPETSGWAAILGLGLDPPTAIEDNRCGPNCGPSVEEPSRCGTGGYRAVDNDPDEDTITARESGVAADRKGRYGPGQGGTEAGWGGQNAGQGAYGPGQGGFGPGQGGIDPGQRVFIPGQGGSGPGQRGLGPGQGGFGSRQVGFVSGQGGFGPGQGGFGAGQGRAGPAGYGAGQGYGPDQEGFGKGRGIHRAGQTGFGIGVKGGIAGSVNAGDGSVGGVVGGAKRRTASDVLIPLIGGGLVFIMLVGSLFRYFNVGSAVKSKVKTITTQIMNQLCEPKASSILSGIGAGVGGAGRGAGAGSGPDFAGAAGAASKECPESFSGGTQRPRTKDPCGKERIHNSRRKYPLPPEPYRFPVIPGLHECTDDEDYEEGVFVAPGPNG